MALVTDHEEGPAPQRPGSPGHKQSVRPTSHRTPHALLTLHKGEFPMSSVTHTDPVRLTSNVRGPVWPRRRHAGRLAAGLRACRDAFQPLPTRSGSPKPLACARRRARPRGGRRGAGPPAAHALSPRRRRGVHCPDATTGECPASIAWAMQIHQEALASWRPARRAASGYRAPCHGAGPPPGAAPAPTAGR